MPSTAPDVSIDRGSSETGPRSGLVFMLPARAASDLFRYMGVSKNPGFLFGGSYNEDYIVFGGI